MRPIHSGLAFGFLATAFLVLAELPTSALSARPVQPPGAPPRAVHQPGLSSAPTIATDGKARITLATNLVDLGRIPQGHVAQIAFVFTNTGTSTLEVMDVRPTCGCTTSGTWDRLVEPGKTGRIPLQFNSANFSAKLSKSVTVICNDPTQPMVSLRIAADIWKPIDIQPNFVYFNSVDPETNETRVARIMNNMDEMLQITELRSTNKMFGVELKEMVPGKEFELRITTVPPLEGVNPQTLILAKTSSTNHPEIRLTAMALVQAPVVAVPQTVMLPEAPLKGASQYIVSVRNNRPRFPMAIESATINLSNVTVRVTEPNPGQLYNLLLSFPQGFEMSPGQMGQLAIVTTHPKAKNLSVNVIQMSPSRQPRSAVPPPVARVQPASTVPVPATVVTNGRVVR